MSDAKTRNDRWLGMSSAQLVIECQDLCRQRDELLAALKRAETAMEICSDWIGEIEMPDGWTTTTGEKLKISAAIASATACGQPERTPETSEQCCNDDCNQGRECPERCQK